MPMTVDPKAFIPLPEEWLRADDRIPLVFLLGVIAGGRIGSLIVPPAEAVLGSIAQPVPPPAVIDDIVEKMIAAIGGRP